jgi:phage terminase large subunit GpA-like protein
MAEPVWDEAERAAWAPPAPILPSGWAERHRRLHRGRFKGPWRNANAPYLRGIMDIPTRPGVVQANLEKAGQIGGSEAMRTLTGYWAHVDPAPMALTLPNQRKGRSIMKSDVRPLFRRTAVLRELIGHQTDALLESISLVNGFSLDLMWSGSATSMAANPYQRCINDEVDKFEPWTGEESDAVAATEGRLTAYEERRCQVNVSTPTTTAGKIHQLMQQSTVRLEWQVPCPHCGRFQALRWAGLKWMDLQAAQVHLAAAEAAAAGGKTGYAVGWDENRRCWKEAVDPAAGSGLTFPDPIELGRHVAWLRRMIERLGAAEDRSGLADVLAAEREAAVWYECRHCRGRIFPRQKAAMIRAGRWSGPDGYVTDFWGARHEDAEGVLRWPWETRIGFQISALCCLWVHWSRLAGEWLRSQGDPAALFFFTTFRLAEAFEFRTRRIPETMLAAKTARAGLEEGIVPRWAWLLLAAIDTQADGFYAVLRAWGGGMRSARVWHGKLATFVELDRLLFVRQWPVEGGEFPPMLVAKTLIDSGGTEDRMLEVSRTQQVYLYAIPRQPAIVAIKGASRPGAGLFWPMRNPMAGGGKTELTDLRALLVDRHMANDLLAEMITAGIPSEEPRAGGPGLEQWLLNKRQDEEYEAHMAAMQRTMDPRTRAEIWTPRATGTPHDYRDCEAYQVVAAYLTNVHLLPEESEVLEWKRQQKTIGETRPQTGPSPGGDPWAVRPL